MHACSVPSVVSDSVIPRTVARQARPLSVGFSRQEHWSGLPFPSFRGSSPPIKPRCHALRQGVLATGHQRSPSYAGFFCFVFLFFEGHTIQRGTQLFHKYWGPPVCPGSPVGPFRILAQLLSIFRNVNGHTKKKVPLLLWL